MAISKDSITITTIIKKEDKKILQEYAAAEGRSLSNYVSQILVEKIKQEELRKKVN
ncbi:hypothetical protein [Listeria welshimeri]|uniref:hypothetical protein n=1 Tax=Listeria welshimeri TaxID=1643 RepID=UPI00162A90EF|nr:hypothetical protein [Listeria welshimeri]MBC1342353.1 hypothetical protein [Listeria welshimeri]MBC1350727.1 hypothetical protein [Listeria welshimeri]MBC1705797.1 hypothetical protein [Listeria welshimeri]MBF2342590.1 hypothetical protein [Listeria welshimeri]